MQKVIRLAPIEVVDSHPGLHPFLGIVAELVAIGQSIVSAQYQTFQVIRWVLAQWMVQRLDVSMTFMDRLIDIVEIVVVIVEVLLLTTTEGGEGLQGTTMIEIMIETTETLGIAVTMITIGVDREVIAGAESVAEIETNVIERDLIDLAIGQEIGHGIDPVSEIGPGIGHVIGHVISPETDHEIDLGIDHEEKAGSIDLVEVGVVEAEVLATVVRSVVWLMLVRATRL